VITWAVTTRNGAISKRLVICQGRDREEAKREAKPELGGNPDDYIVNPLTRPQDVVVIKLQIKGKEDDASPARPRGW